MKTEHPATQGKMDGQELIAAIERRGYNIICATYEGETVFILAKDGTELQPHIYPQRVITSLLLRGADSTAADLIATVEDVGRELDMMSDEERAKI